MNAAETQRVIAAAAAQFGVPPERAIFHGTRGPQKEVFARWVAIWACRQLWPEAPQRALAAVFNTARSNISISLKSLEEECEVYPAMEAARRAVLAQLNISGLERPERGVIGVSD